MQYNIPPIFYIQNFQPTYSLVKDLNLDSLCLFLDENFNQQSQQIIIAANFLLMPIIRMNQLSVTHLTKLQVLSQWKNCILNQFSLKFQNFSNFIQDKLNQFSLYVEQNTILFESVLNYVPELTKYEISSVFVPAISILPLSDAKPIEFYEEQANNYKQQASVKQQAYEQQIQYDYKKMCIEEKFGGLLQIEILNLKEAHLQDQDRARIEANYLQNEEDASQELSIQVREDLEKRAEQHKLDLAVQEKLAVVQTAMIKELQKLTIKKK